MVRQPRLGDEALDHLGGFVVQPVRVDASVDPLNQDGDRLDADGLA